MNINDLTPEQMAKLQECTTPEEILALAKEEGRELTDDEIEAISGGHQNDGKHWLDQVNYYHYCSKCNDMYEVEDGKRMICPKCGQDDGTFNKNSLKH